MTVDTNAGGFTREGKGPPQYSAQSQGPQIIVHRVPKIANTTTACSPNANALYQEFVEETSNAKQELKQLIHEETSRK